LRTLKKYLEKKVFSFLINLGNKFSFLHLLVQLREFFLTESSSKLRMFISFISSICINYFYPDKTCFKKIFVNVSRRRLVELHYSLFLLWKEFLQYSDMYLVMSCFDLNLLINSSIFISWASSLHFLLQCIALFNIYNNKCY
jgi:hypothetical protein